MSGWQFIYKAFADVWLLKVGFCSFKNLFGVEKIDYIDLCLNLETTSTEGFLKRLFYEHYQS